MGPLKRWQAGDLITHGRLNKMQFRADLAGKVTGAGATTVGLSTTGSRTSSRIVVPPVLFEVYQPLTYPANAKQEPYTEAKRVYLHPVTGLRGLGSNPVLERIYHPLALRDADDNYIGLPTLRAGMYVYTVWNRQSGRWEIITPATVATELTYRFELYENLAFGEHATAKLLYWDSDESDYAADDDTTFEVYDAFNKFNQNCKPTGQGGARGYARYFLDADRWEIIEMEHQARWIRFIVNEGSGFATSDASFAVDGVTYHDGYEPDTAVTTVHNEREHAADTYIFEGNDDDRGFAKYDPATDQYSVDNMECP